MWSDNDEAKITSDLFVGAPAGKPTSDYQKETSDYIISRHLNIKAETTSGNICKRKHE